MFSGLLLARDEDGVALTDREVRDELLTLLLAGHETTATGLAWTFDLVLHDARVRARAREGDDRYLDAVVKESLRIRPVIPGVGRVVRQRPFADRRLRGAGGRGDQPVDPQHPPPRRPVPQPAGVLARAVPLEDGPRRTPTPGCRSAVAPGAAWARALP